MTPVLAAILMLHSVSGSEIDVNPKSIISMREARPNDSYFAEGVRCMINTSDGKFVTVVETCEEIRGLIREYDK